MIPNVVVFIVGFASLIICASCFGALAGDTKASPGRVPTCYAGCISFLIGFPIWIWLCAYTAAPLVEDHKETYTVSIVEDVPVIVINGDVRSALPLVKRIPKEGDKLEATYYKQSYYYIKKIEDIPPTWELKK